MDVLILMLMDVLILMLNILARRCIASVEQRKISGKFLSRMTGVRASLHMDLGQ